MDYCKTATETHVFYRFSMASLKFQSHRSESCSTASYKRKNASEGDHSTFPSKKNEISLRKSSITKAKVFEVL